MTRQYLAVAAREGLAEALPHTMADTLARDGCAERWRGHGLVLFASDALPLRKLRDRSGFVIGPVFDSAGADAADELDAELSQEGADKLIGRIWGSYVAFSGSRSGFAALRDPSGGLACYHARVGRYDCFTSVPHLLIDSGSIPIDIDWHAIARSLVRHAARPIATALRGIDELEPGTLLQAQDGSIARRRIWDPWRYAATRPDRDDAETLERVLDATLGAWGRSVARPLIEISGGLDSAVVAAGVSRTAPDASLITFAAACGDPDETGYARAIARHLRLPLEIVSPRLEDVDLTRSLSCDLPRPNARAFTQAADAQSLRHARTTNAGAFMSGGGGDDVFCYLRTILPALDRLRAEGVRKMAATAEDVAVMNHSTLREAYARIARRLLRGPPAGGKADLRFMSPDFRAEGGTHATEDRARSRPPGKAAHIRGIATMHNYLEGHARADFAPILSPLLSQPIVECCLAIPTWRWRAFTGHLPRPVIERRSKGSFDGFCALLLHRHCALVRELLLEGRLAGQGLLDRAALAAALQHPSPPAETVSRILALVDVESWARSWMTRRR